MGIRSACMVSHLDVLGNIILINKFVYNFYLQARIVELKSLGVEKLSTTMLIINENEFRKVIQRIQRINSLRQNLT